MYQSLAIIFSRGKWSSFNSSPKDRCRIGGTFGIGYNPVLCGTSEEGNSANPKSVRNCRNENESRKINKIPKGSRAVSHQDTWLMM
jgi:hypothetical protein